MRNYLSMIYAILKLNIIHYKRYWFNTILIIFGMYLFFLIIFFTGRQIGGDRFNVDKMDGLVIGYLLVMVSMMGLNSIYGKITSSSREGTFEQVYMTPLGYNNYLLINMLISYMMCFILYIPLVIIMMLTTGHFFSGHFWLTLPILTFNLLSIWGISYILGSLAMVFKQVSAITGFFNLAIVGLVAAPIDKLPILKLLPYSQGCWIIQRIIRDGYNIIDFPLTDWLIWIINCIVYFALGQIIFSIMDKKARKMGKLGHH